MNYFSTDTESDDSDPADGGDFLFAGLSADSLPMQYSQRDDLFTGIASKRRFTRRSGYEGRRFLFQEELFIIANFYFRTYLQFLMGQGFGLFIWVTRKK